MLEPAALIVLAFAVYRATRLVTTDTLTRPWRAWLYAWAWDESKPITVVGPDGVVSREPSPRAAWRTWAYELLTCAYCLGVWVAGAGFWAWRDGPAWARTLLVVLAIGGAQSALHSRTSE